MQRLNGERKEKSGEKWKKSGVSDKMKINIVLNQRQSF